MDHSRHYPRHVHAAITPLAPGTPAPDFSLHSTPDQTVSLHEFRGRPVILAFYPADWSPVCSDQMGLYNEILSEFRHHNAALLGISVDGVWCHLAFARDRKLHFPLLADFEPKGAVSRAYGAYQPAADGSRPSAPLRDRRRGDHLLELPVAGRRQPGRRRNPERARRSASQSKGQLYEPDPTDHT